MPDCPCCQQPLSDRQIRRHLVRRREEIQAFLDALGGNDEPGHDEGEGENGEDGGDGGNDLPLHGNGPAPNDDGIAPNNDGLAPIALDEAEIELDHAGPAPDLPGPLAYVDVDRAPAHAHAHAHAHNQAQPVPPPAEQLEDEEADHWPDVDLDALVALEDEDEDEDEDEEDGMELFNDFDFNDMDSDDEDDLFVPHPDVPLPPAPAEHRDPVIIENWNSSAEDLGELDEEELAELEGFNIEDLPITPPGSDDGASDASADEPEFREDDGQRGLNPDDEPDMNDQELWEMLQEHLGDLAEDEWRDIYNRYLTDRDQKTLLFLAARQRTHFSRAVYDDLRLHACEELGLPSDFVAWRRLKILSGLETRTYHCCINSCICYVGKYRDMESCPECDEPRLNAQGKPRRLFHYTPLIRQLIGLFQNRTSIENMRHRAKHDAWRIRNPGKISDVFDGQLYQTLKATKVFEEDPYCFFQNPEDVALGLGTDGFSLFKRRPKADSTAWPLILVNYNLHPSIRYRLENIICVGVIPGPKECKDINSFLAPLVEELLELAEGVATSRLAVGEEVLAGEGTFFVLRAFLIILFGDIPAISKLLKIKGHNGITPCRTCLIQGTKCHLPEGGQVYYVPLTAPGEPVFDPAGLIPRSQMTFLRTYEALEREPRVGRRAQLAQDTGINGRPVLAELGSLDLASCAPYEMMHLIFENLVPNMVNLWKDQFKWLGGREAYHVPRDAWKVIGTLTADAMSTIPAQFVGTLPNIDKDMSHYKAEAYSFWFTYLAPILLHGKLQREYYRHFLAMREIVIWCLQLEISHAEIDALEQKINQWVQDYERLYYRYDHDRLPTCVLTIHALLHMPHYIRRTGPLSGTWSFVMERFCGYLLRPALSNRLRPFDALDNFIRRRAQMQIVAKVFDMPQLLRSLTNLVLVHGELISSKEKIYDFKQDYVLGQPMKPIPRPPIELQRQMCRYFGVAEGPVHGEGPRPTLAEIIVKLDFTTLVRYGRFRMTSMGDRVRTSDIVRKSVLARDNSFIRYEGLPDRNAQRPRDPDQAVRRVYYARVEDVYYIEFIRNQDTNERVPYLLACVQDCNTQGLDASKPENPIVTYNHLKSAEIINLGMVQAAVGRIRVGGRNTWAIVDRTNGARTQFNNDAGVPEPELE